MSRNFYTGIDIGSYQIKVVIAQTADNADMPMQVIGVGAVPSRGVRQGYITDRAEVVKCLREAIARAQSAAKVTIKSARVSMGGIGIEEMKSSGDVSLTASGGIVAERDTEKALRESEKRASQKLINRTILHTIPLEYRIDGAKVFGKPQGLQGTKLSVDTLLITTLAQHYDEVLEAVEAAGVEVVGVMAAPLAASLVTLNKHQKTAGVALAAIGAETVSLIVFDEDIPVSVKVLPLGATALTNAIALAFQIPLMEAEQIKRGAVTGSDIAPKRIETIAAAELKKMFAQVNLHLRAIGRAGLLPAGIVLTGGGAGLAAAPIIARAVLKIPAQVAVVGPGSRTAAIDPSWTVAYGLCRWGFAEDSSYRGSSLSEILGSGWERIKDGVRALLP